MSAAAAVAAAQFVLLVGCACLVVYTATQVFGWHGFLLNPADTAYGEEDSKALCVPISSPVLPLLWQGTGQFMVSAAGHASKQKERSFCDTQHLCTS